MNISDLVFDMICWYGVEPWIPLAGKLVLALELIPAFATYRGLYEFAQYAFRAVYTVRFRNFFLFFMIVCSKVF